MLNFIYKKSIFLNSENEVSDTELFVSLTSFLTVNHNTNATYELWYERKPIRQAKISLISYEMCVISDIFTEKTAKFTHFFQTSFLFSKKF